MFPIRPSVLNYGWRSDLQPSQLQVIDIKSLAEASDHKSLAAHPLQLALLFRINWLHPWSSSGFYPTFPCNTPDQHPGPAPCCIPGKHRLRSARGPHHIRAKFGRQLVEDGRVVQGSLPYAGHEGGNQPWLRHYQRHYPLGYQENY